ncbi:MAG: DUF1570 domain-containing protein [Planctomycetota bacterium]|jgi:hypothetical protein
MRIVLKAAVVLVPILVIVVLLRMCDRDSGRRWLERVQVIDPDLVLARESPELIAIGPTVDEAAHLGAIGLATRMSLAEEYGDLLGEGVDRRMVVVIFSRTEHIREFAGQDVRVDRKSLEEAIGLTLSDRNAILLPPGRDIETLQHEVVHLLMGQSKRIGVRYSPWLAEGLAQYFEGYSPGGHRLAREQKVFLRHALGKTGIDVSALIRTQDYDRFLQNEGAKNYIKALALVTYLMETQPRERMADYIDGEKLGQADRYKLFKQAFGDPETMGNAVLQHLQR